VRSWAVGSNGTLMANGTNALCMDSNGPATTGPGARRRTSSSCRAATARRHRSGKWSARTWARPCRTWATGCASTPRAGSWVGPFLWSSPAAPASPLRVSCGPCRGSPRRPLC
jgi:hypothetical protein